MTQVSSMKKEKKKTVGIIINSTDSTVKLTITENQHKIEDIHEQTQYKAKAGIGVAVGLGNVGG